MNNVKGAIFTNPAVPDFFRAETIVAYPFSAKGTAVKMHMRFKIGLFKSRLMFAFPQYLSCHIMFNAGKPSFHKWLFLTLPFLPAAVAEKTEGKAFFAGMIRCLTC